MISINYSIIIPHKNIPKLLQRCLDSIPRREDIQIIVVDDNSDENKVNFESFPGLNDKFVEVYFTKEGKGAGYARNVGLQHAKGKWLLFADADDFFITENFTQLINYYKDDTHTDIVYLNAFSSDNETFVQSSIQPNIKKWLENDKFTKDELLEKLKFKTWEPWTRMIKHHIIKSNNLKFDEIPRQNDITFGITVSIYSKIYAIETMPIYCWVHNNNSISKRKINEESFIDLLTIQIGLNDLYKLKGIKRRECILYYIYRSYREFNLKFTIKKCIPILLKKRINPFTGLYTYLKEYQPIQ